MVDGEWWLWMVNGGGDNDGNVFFLRASGAED